jgi:hypothetical protein
MTLENSDLLRGPAISHSPRDKQLGRYEGLHTW